MLIWTFSVLAWVALWVLFPPNRAPWGWTPTICPPSIYIGINKGVEVTCGRYPSGFV